MTLYATKCACGAPLMTGDVDGMCISCRSLGLTIVPTSNGWLCPRCQTVNAPHVLKCDCPPPSITTGGT